MPESYMSLFPQILNGMELMKLSVQTGIAFSQTARDYFDLGFKMAGSFSEAHFRNMRTFSPLFSPESFRSQEHLFHIQVEITKVFMNYLKKNLQTTNDRFLKDRQVELDFLKIFTEKPEPQDWTFEYDDSNVLLDLPSLRLIDLSEGSSHNIQNYAVVFAPRAGHHSNIAERVALYMKSAGLSRMAIVEQKCAEEVPLYVNGKRHYENFSGQVNQYRQILEHLKGLAGRASHLIAICQPGPLLMATLIMHPELGRTFGSAGSPMHTEGEQGYLTEFSRMVGEEFIERIIELTQRTVSEGHPGVGRKFYDGRLQVSGFYYLGMDQHLKNFLKLLDDLKQGDEAAVERQRAFYHWYNTVNHSPVGFIRDTYKEIFVRNALIRGTLNIDGKRISIEDYPRSIPIWAIGGTRDDITPPKQATGHIPLIRSMPQKDKLTIVCNAGHMGLFRSRKILKEHYQGIVEFILAHSDGVS